MFSLVTAIEETIQRQKGRWRSLLFTFYQISRGAKGKSRPESQSSLLLLVGMIVSVPLAWMIERCLAIIVFDIQTDAIIFLLCMWKRLMNY